MRPLLALLVLAACDPPQPCEQHADCAATEYCDAFRPQDPGVCTETFGARYRFIMVGAEVGANRPDGSPWAGGDPDLYAVFGFIEDRACQTSTVSESRNPTWNESCEFRMDSGDDFGIELWQADSLGDAWVAGWIWESDQDLVDLAREAYETVLLTDTSGTVDFAYAVEPVR